MINKQIEKLLLCDEHSLMINSEDVATVRTENSLLHAMMILTNVGYSSVPVLDKEHKLQGVVTLPRIIDGIKNQVSYDFDQLSEQKVEDVLCSDCNDFSIIEENANLEEILRQLVSHNYVCIVDQENVFLGIVTRKTILKRFNYLVHEIDNRFELIKKEH